MRPCSARSCSGCWRAPFWARASRILWHAGEPLTRPPAFYDAATAILREVLAGHPELMVDQAMQTNGTLINRRLVRLLSPQSASRWG